MAKVALRVYNHEIEGMIEGGHLDESVAHCQFILKTFPMHVETYRLLGKTFLEARRYADAADIFQRVLMAVPDDFVSHVGMSIIRDDEGKLDNAIWHMERAFEVQPSNPAIQGELRRLYGRRDGIEPPKIRLSRDALANMYSQGELFNQAIAEIRAVLAEDANRPDLQVMLARAYYRAGQKVEAAEMASTLLRKFPYCLDALRILVDVLPGTARAENTQVYRQRLIVLDPYSQFTTGSVFASDQVADSAVNLERMDYKGGSSGASEPNWAASLGIKLTGDKRSEQPPEWLSAAAAQPPEASPSAPAAAVAAEVPDWMRTAGWQESTGAATEENSAFASEPASDEPIAKAEIPDWLQSMAPAGEADAAALPPEPAAPAPQESGEVPDWLSSLGGISQPETGSPIPSTHPTQAEEPAASAAPSAAGLPDWLTSLGGETPVGVTMELDSSVVEPPTGSPMPASQPDSDEPEPADEADESESVPVELPEIKAEPPEPGQALPGSDVQEFVPSGEVKPLDIGDDALGWLESLAAKQGAKPEELLTNPQNRSEDMPDWIQNIDQPGSAPAEPVVPVQAEASSAPVAEETFPAAPIESPAEEMFAGPDQLAPSEPARDDNLSWLSELTAKEPAQPAAPAPAEDRPESMPDWIQRPPAAESAPLESPAQVVEPPVSVPAAHEEDATITSWLSELDKVESSQPEVPAGPVAEAVPTPQDELPEWLKDMEKPVPVEPEPEPNPNPNPETPIADLPDWLKEPASPGQTRMLGPMAPEATPSVVIPQPVAPAPEEETEMPAWMDEAAPPDHPVPPTEPAEWVPVEAAGVTSAATVPTPKPAVEPSKPVNEPTSTKPTAPVVPPAVRDTGSLARAGVSEKDSDILAEAQAELERNSLETAIKSYAKLIKKARLLDEVIHDLREATYRYPVDVVVWQTLGDAYMRANRLQDALDAYTKAEELLR